MTPEEMKDFEEAITSQGGQLSCVVAADQFSINFIDLE